jgi:hypothetical protein
MLVNSFNLSQSFNYKPYLFYQKTVQIRDHFFLYMAPGSCAVLGQPLRGAPTQLNLE